MASQTRSPTSGTTGTPNDWANPGNITALDGSYATNSLAHGSVDTTPVLRAGGFGFTIPAGATIDGIAVTWYRSAVNAFVRDGSVRLETGGSAVGDDKADTGTDWDNPGPGPTAKGYGGPTDTWGRAWTPAEINAANFGATLTAAEVSLGSSGVSVDYAEVTVYYTAGAAALDDDGLVWQTITR